MSGAPPPGPSSGYRAPKFAFIGKPAPPGYVAGVGRGATGFTTRSDIGPAREAAAKFAEASSALKQRPQGKRQHNDEDEEDDLNETNYDEFAGYGGALFNKAPYEEDDEEADKVYEAIDKHQDERGKALREAKIRKEREEFRTKRPKIQQQFSSLKLELRELSDLDWASIPEVGDARNRKQRVARQDKFTPVPDSLLAHQAKLISGGEKLVYIDPKAMDAADDDSDAEEDPAKLLEASKNKPATQFDTGLNIDEMSEFRSSYMSMKLNRASTSSGIPTSDGPITNAQDYLTNLESTMPSQITDEATLKEFRKLFSSLRASNPTFHNAWIASVRLEEAAGKLKTARTLVMAGCEQCSESEEIWLEAIRLHPPDTAKPLIIKAITKVPRSDKLWIKAAELESDNRVRRQVYAKARVLVPKSVLIWKKSIELEEPEEARLLLNEAVECCPGAIEFWLALAKLEPYEKAMKVLVKAAELNPTERSIWIMAAKLQEHVGNTTRVGGIIRNAIEEISKRKVEIKRDDWLKEAISAGGSGYKVTCAEIIKRVIGQNLESCSAERRLEVWLSDVERCCSPFSSSSRGGAAAAEGGSIECARTIFKLIVSDRELCRQESVWLKYVKFEKAYGNKESLDEVLELSVEQQHCPKSKTLWLLLADLRKGKLNECRKTLSDALDANPDSEDVIIKAVELECENDNYVEAQRILSDACSSAKTAKLVLKSAELELELGNLEKAEDLLRKACEEYKNVPEFYLRLGQLELRRERDEQAKICFSNGLKFNPTSVELWINLAKIDKQRGFISKARSRLEMARLRNPKAVKLWLEAVELELATFKAKQGGSSGSHQSRPDIAMTLLANGIRACKDSPDVDKLIELQRELS